jgi:predicted DnaQ family exonuclease/DinG family helicase
MPESAVIGRPLVSIDLEMTSARPEAQEIIEVAAVKFIGDRVVDSFSTLVQPPVPLPYGIQVLTGISPADLARAPKLEQVAPRLMRFLGDAPLVAHTVSSDVNALARKGFQLGNEQIDTFELASILLPRLESYSLASLVQHFGIAHPRQHRALPDARVTHQLYLRLVERALELDTAILREIVEMTFPTMWPLRTLFQAIEELRSRNAAGGATIRDQLAAKMGAGQASLDAVLSREDVPALVPSGTRSLVDVAAVEGALAPRGAVASALDGFEDRPGQRELARAVANTFNAGGALLAEGGTGVGKSLAYLLPAARFAAQNGERVVVSTNTINLQEQLYLKDIPDVQRLIDVRAAVLKGRQNYLCFQRWSALRHRPDLTLNEILTLIKVLVWLPQTDTGDVGELNLTEAERSVWSRLNSHPELCSQRRCAMAGRRGCFLHYARERAAGAHLVVVNHALLLSDVAVDSKVLPDYRYLVIDEAHHLEDQATNQLGYVARLRDVLEYLDLLGHTSQERRSGVVNELGSHFRGSGVGQTTQRQAELIAQELSAAVERARAVAAAFFDVAATFLRVHGAANRGYDQRTRFTRALRAQPAWSQVEAAWDRLAGALFDVQTPTERLHTLLVALEEQNVLEYELLVGTLESALRFNGELRVQGAAVVGSPDPERIYWGSIVGGELELRSAPLVVGPLLRSSLFDQKEATILTSATLTTDGSFTYIQSRLGLEDAATLQVGSPFDYARTTLLCLPSDVPDPDRPDFSAALARSLVAVCGASQGRALVLFTSHTALRQVWQAIRRPLEQRGIQVLAQGVEGTSRRHLLHAFKTNPRAVLLGASSFWEGIDVVGEGLSVLAIAKLPFPVPTDPVISARSELFDDPFLEYQVPTTILKLKQGFGRLIRSRTDRGVVICYDRRVLTKSYGQAVLRSLPPAQQRRETLATLPETVSGWLREPRDSASAPAPARR